MCGFDGWYQDGVGPWDIENDPVTGPLQLRANWREHWPDSAWTSENGRHYHLCQNGCGIRLEEAACTGGRATCTERAVCDVCGQPYGELDSTGHTGTVQWTGKNGRGHVGTYSCCGAAVTQAHVWGGDAVCDVCGYDQRQEDQRGGTAAPGPTVGRAPATGDESGDVLFWTVLLTVSCAGLMAMIPGRRRNGGR